MLKNKPLEDKYIPEDPLEVLKNYQEAENFYEVLYTLGKEEIIKDNGKYYIASTIYPTKKKEISSITANEIWQSYSMKSRSDTLLSVKDNVRINNRKKHM